MILTAPPPLSNPLPDLNLDDVFIWSDEITILIRTAEGPGAVSQDTLDAMVGHDVGEGSAIEMVRALDNGDIEMRMSVLAPVGPALVRAAPIVYQGLRHLVYLGLTWVGIDIVGDLTSEDSKLSENLGAVGAATIIPLVVVLAILMMIK